MSDLEKVHEACIKLHTEKESFVQCDESFYKRLDDYLFAPSGDPFLLTGRAGSGKSALVSNWVKRCRLNYMQSHDFCHVHFATNPETRKLSNVLYRLQTALKQHFRLRKIAVRPTVNELRVDFPSILKAAANRASQLGAVNDRPARIVIVIDSLDAITDSAGNEVNPKLWLPRSLPRSVKLVL